MAQHGHSCIEAQPLNHQLFVKEAEGSVGSLQSSCPGAQSVPMVHPHSLKFTNSSEVPPNQLEKYATLPKHGVLVLVCDYVQIM